jgi:arylsulfatase A-like enzyme
LNKVRSIPMTKNLRPHLFWGTFSGLTVGITLAGLECLFLLCRIGPFLIDPPFLLRAILSYGLLGGGAGFVVSASVDLLFVGRKAGRNDQSSALYFPLFLALGFLAEAFLYLTDIYPYGGPNKWSPKTLMMIGVSAGLSVLLPIAAWRTAKRAFKRSAQSILPVLVSLIVILCFLGLYLFSVQEEGKKVQAKRARMGQRPPDILFLLVDSLRSDHLSVSGYGLPTSPHLDELASQGVFFKSVLATSTWSVPTHASLFTGLYPSSHGAYSLFSVLDEKVTTLAEILSRGGFYSLSLYNNPLIGKGSGLERGFDRDLGVEVYDKASLTLTRVIDKFIRKSPPSERMLQIAIRWISHCRKLNLPYFIFMNLFDVHYPYVPQEPFFSEFLKTVPVGQVNLPLVRRFSALSKSKAEKARLVAKMTAADFRYLFTMYDSTIRRTDEKIGSFIDLLKSRRWLDQALIVVTADHGDYLGEHSQVGHLSDSLYNPILKVPLVLWYPSKLRPRMEEGWVSQADVFPTVLSLAGLQDNIPPRIQGVDLFSLQRPEGILAEFWNDARNEFTCALVTQGMKLVADEKGRLELYDLRQDPGENNNLASLDRERAEELYNKMEFMRGGFVSYGLHKEMKKRKELGKVLKSLGYISR